MFNLNEYLDAKLPSVDFSKIALPQLTLPDFTLPDVDLPEFTLPRLESPVSVDQVVTFARDAAYVGIGATVVTAQQVDQYGRAVGGKLVDGIRSITAR